MVDYTGVPAATAIYWCQQDYCGTSFARPFDFDGGINLFVLCECGNMTMNQHGFLGQFSKHYIGKGKSKMSQDVKQQVIEAVAWGDDNWYEHLPLFYDFDVMCWLAVDLIEKYITKNNQNDTASKRIIKLFSYVRHKLAWRESEVAMHGRHKIQPWVVAHESTPLDGNKNKDGPRWPADPFWALAYIIDAIDVERSGVLYQRFSCLKYDESKERGNGSLDTGFKCLNKILPKDKETRDWIRDHANFLQAVYDFGQERGLLSLLEGNPIMAVNDHMFESYISGWTAIGEEPNGGEQSVEAA